ncbi:MAG: LysR substrate-binding domain-containing protein [Rhodococcus sp. (in: high G+C Gram-positive bacteria)]
MDLNLIKTFVLLYETRSVTSTANKLFLTQPTVSYSLKGLRRHFNDDLFTRGPSGLVPTLLATSMYENLRQALEVIEETVGGHNDFDPETTERTFRLCGTDLGEMTLFPGVLGAIAERAPHCQVQITSLDYSTAADQLRMGQTDGVICTPRIDTPSLVRSPLFSEHYVGLCARSHPRIGPIPTLEEYLGERHIDVDSAAGHVDAGKAIDRLGRPRDVAVRVPHFTALPELVSRTDYLAIVPSRVAALFTGSSRVRTFALPVDPQEAEVALYVARRALPSAAIDWLRRLIVDVLHTRPDDRRSISEHVPR